MSSAAREADGTRGSINKQEMFETFQTWALQNYGDSGKTKTVTRKKHERIVKILTGEEPSTAENSKFRFWVKAKGFRLGHSESKERGDRTIYVPTKHVVSSFLNLFLCSFALNSFVFSTGELYPVCVYKFGSLAIRTSCVRHSYTQDVSVYFLVIIEWVLYPTCSETSSSIHSLYLKQKFFLLGVVSHYLGIVKRA